MDCGSGRSANSIPLKAQTCHPRRIRKFASHQQTKPENFPKQLCSGKGLNAGKSCFPRISVAVNLPENSDAACFMSLTGIFSSAARTGFKNTVKSVLLPVAVAVPDLQKQLPS